MVSVDSRPLYLQRWNSADFILNLLVSGFVALLTADCVVALMVGFDLSIPIPHKLDKFMALTLFYCN